MLSLLSASYETSAAGALWRCKISMTRNNDTWTVSTSVPPEVARPALQGYLEEREGELWALALEEGFQEVTRMPSAGNKKLLEVAITIGVEEINVLRARHLLPQISTKAFLQRMQEKLDETQE